MLAVRRPEAEQTALQAIGAGGETLPAVRCIFTVDVEDWFHILDLSGAPRLSEWDSLPSRVERNFLRLLDLFAAGEARVTCFFLGWVAHKFPHLVCEAQARGHEVASHGYAHRLAYAVGRREFLEDARLAKRILEDVAGRPVLGYRCAGFSVTERVPWFFEALAEAGYLYDSSVFPARRNHGGLPSASLRPAQIRTGAGEIFELPITVARLLRTSLCFFGGGYLRLFPLPVISAMARRVLREGRPVVFYVHPREIDPDQPRLPMPAGRAFRCYVNLRSTAAKIQGLLRQFEFTTCESYLEEISSRLGRRADRPTLSKAACASK